MRYLLDTCIVSEFIKIIPNQSVIDFIDSINENDLFLSALTIGELYKGLGKLNDGQRKTRLLNWVQYELLNRFEDRIVDIDSNITKLWGTLTAESEKKGVSASVIDSLLAATCIVYDMTFVTRNVKDVKFADCKLVNPFE